MLRRISIWQFSFIFLIVTGANATADRRGGLPGTAQVHDLSLRGENSCRNCHAQRSSGEQVVALWNPGKPSARYTMYDSPTIDMRVASQPSGISMLCLSCHDGSIATDTTNTGPLFGSNDLSRSHPISVTYDASRDFDFATAANGQVGGLPLYGDHKDQVECATCHNPHDDSGRALLRINNRGSALCLACHTK